MKTVLVPRLPDIAPWGKWVVSKRPVKDYRPEFEMVSAEDSVATNPAPYLLTLKDIEREREWEEFLFHLTDEHMVEIAKYLYHKRIHDLRDEMLDEEEFEVR